MPIYIRDRSLIVNGLLLESFGVPNETSVGGGPLPFPVSGIVSAYGRPLTTAARSSVLNHKGQLARSTCCGEIDGRREPPFDEGLHKGPSPAGPSGCRAVLD